MLGEGHFFISIHKNSAYQVGAEVQAGFSISQHSRESNLLQSLTEYLNCGKYRPHASRDIGEFMVMDLPSIMEKIIPFPWQQQQLSAE